MYQQNETELNKQIRIEQYFHRKLKVRASEAGITLKSLIGSIMRNYFKNNLDNKNESEHTSNTRI